jgi:error-prone DNA polymerase
MESTDDGYAEFSAFTNYSFLYGGSSPEEMATEAARLGLRAIAVTDLHGVYGMPKMWGALRDLPNPPRLLVGARLPLELSGDVNLIAKTRSGYGALCRLLTEAHRHSPKGESSLSVPDFLKWMRSLPGADDLFLFPQWEDEWEVATDLVSESGFGRFTSRWGWGVCLFRDDVRF